MTTTRIEHLPTCEIVTKQSEQSFTGCTCRALDRANERIAELEKNSAIALSGHLQMEGEKLDYLEPTLATLRDRIESLEDMLCDIADTIEGIDCEKIRDAIGTREE